MVNIAKNQFFFIGYKNATDCIASLQVIHNGIIINELFQDQYNRHSFVFNQVKSYSQKENKRDSYTLWENDESHNPSVCGVYISYWELYQQTVNSNIQKIKFEFDIKINFDHLIVFENMYEYLSSILGKLELKLKVSPDVLVWCCVDPKESLLHGVEALPLRESTVPIGPRRMPGDPDETVGMNVAPLFLAQVANSVINKSKAEVYTKRFTQVNTPGRACTNVVSSSYFNNDLNNLPYLTNFVDFASYETRDIEIHSDDVTISNAYSHVTVFNLKDTVKKRLIEEYKDKPFVVPSSKFEFYQFGQGPNPTKFNISQQFKLPYTKALFLIFPRYGTQISCMQNPFLDNLCMQLLNKQFPKTATSTPSTDHLKQNFNLMGLKEYFHCPKEIENSYVILTGTSYPNKNQGIGDET
jgi:hypothetical protein